MSLHQLPCQPDRDAMHAFVAELFSTSGLDGYVEIAWTSLSEPHRLENARAFGLGDLDEAVEYASEINAAINRNVYVSAGLRTEAVNRRGSDDDVLACVALWADFDRPGAFDVAMERTIELGLPPTITTYTGVTPHLRGQMWWLLEEPTRDLKLHRSLCHGLAKILGGDTTVVNPSRVMRLAGSVAWPLKAGRQVEMTGLFDDPRLRKAPYQIEEVSHRLRKASAFEEPAENRVLDFNAAAPTLDIDHLVEGARRKGEWHKHALLATAHLLGRGTPPDVVLDLLTGRLQQPGYTYLQTHADLVVMVRGALQRGLYKPHAPIADAPADASKPEPAQPATPASPFLSISSLAALKPPEWMVDGYLTMEGLSAIVAPPGAFKSFLALDMALSVAYGIPWHGHHTQKRKVIYILAEGRGGFLPRIVAWQAARVAGQDTDQFLILPTPVDMLAPAAVGELIRAIDDHAPDAGFVIVDTVARNFGAGDENKTQDMNSFINGTGRLVERGTNVLLVHHTGKNEALGERGSSVLRGALDTSLRLTRDGVSDAALLTAKKQKDAPEPRPMRLLFPIVEAVHPVTGEVLTSRVPTLAGADDEGADEGEASAGDKATARLSRLQRQLLEAVRDGVGSVTILAKFIPGVRRDNIDRALQRLEERGHVEFVNGFWRVKQDAEDDEDDD